MDNHEPGYPPPEHKFRNLPLGLSRQPQAVQVIEPKPKTRFSRIELIAISGLVALSLYLIAEYRTQSVEFQAQKAQNTQSITVLSQQLKQEAEALKQFEQSNKAALQQFEATNSAVLRTHDQVIATLNKSNARIEQSIHGFEKDSALQKETNARLIANEARLAERLDAMATRLAKSPTEAVPVPAPPANSPAIQTPAPTRQQNPVVATNHRHEYMGEATAPRGVVVLDQNGEVTWFAFKDGKEQKIRPIEPTSTGYLVHNFTDGRDYILTMSGEWIGGAY